MRHHKKIRKFGRERGQRNALLKSLLLALIEHGRIHTTEAKAKELRGKIEKMVTKAKTKNLATYRLLAERLYNQKKAAKKLIEEIAPRYLDRHGGYTRIIKLPVRKSDSSRQALIEFV